MPLCGGAASMEGGTWKVRRPRWPMSWMEFGAGHVWLGTRGHFSGIHFPLPLLVGKGTGCAQHLPECERPEAAARRVSSCGYSRPLSRIEVFLKALATMQKPH